MNLIPDMGENAAFIWSAWGVAVLVLGGLFAATMITLRTRRRTLADLEGRDAT